MAYTAKKMVKGTQSEVAETVQEYWELVWDGFRPDGDVSPVILSPFARQEYVDDAVDPLRAEVDGRLSAASLSATLVSVQTVDLSGGNVTLAAVTARRMDLIGATAARTLTLPNATASTTVTNSTNYTVTLIRSGATVGVPLAAGDTIDLRA